MNGIPFRPFRIEVFVVYTGRAALTNVEPFYTVMRSVISCATLLVELQSALRDEVAGMIVCALLVGLSKIGSCTTFECDDQCRSIHVR